MPISHRARSLRVAIAAVLAATSLAAPRLVAQDTTSTANLRPTPDSQLVKLTLRDGSVLIGRVTDVSPTVLIFASGFGTSVIPRASIRKVEFSATRRLHEGEFWPEDPSRTRLFFAPTGRMLRRGEGYFSDAYIFFPSFQGGLTDRVNFGGGMSLFPGVGLDEQVYFVTPKIGVIARPKLNVAVGALVAGVPDFFEDSPVGLAYGVATYGGEDASVTVGSGFGFSRSSTSQALIMFGGSARLSRTIALVSENYVYSGDGTNGLVSAGIRFMGEQIAVDLAGFTASGADVPIIPYVAFIYRF
ncbi:MAG TPA: hypothetical protein VF034_00775 [Gemmatimonadaceae bacterium]|jgi:hypothetical protein